MDKFEIRFNYGAQCELHCIIDEYGTKSAVWGRADQMNNQRLALPQEISLEFIYTPAVQSCLVLGVGAPKGSEFDMTGTFDDDCRVVVALLNPEDGEYGEPVLNELIRKGGSLHQTVSIPGQESKQDTAQEGVQEST